MQENFGNDCLKQEAVYIIIGQKILTLFCRCHRTKHANRILTQEVYILGTVEINKKSFPLELEFLHLSES